MKALSISCSKQELSLNNFFIIGEIIGLIGLASIIITPFSLIILLLGSELLHYGYNEAKSWNNGIM